MKKANTSLLFLFLLVISIISGCSRQIIQTFPGPQIQKNEIAILSVLFPSDTNYYYFIIDGNSVKNPHFRGFFQESGSHALGILPGKHKIKWAVKEPSGNFIYHGYGILNARAGQTYRIYTSYEKATSSAPIIPINRYFGIATFSVESIRTWIDGGDKEDWQDLMDSITAQEKEEIQQQDLECLQNEPQVPLFQNPEYREREMKKNAQKVSDKYLKFDSTELGGRIVTLKLGRNVTMNFMLIPAGKFIMGSPSNEAERDADEGPQREVTISEPFYIGICEVTQEQYEAIMGNNPSIWKSNTNPVDSVSWEDAMTFCKKLSQKTGKKITLPTEAQWEYACRAGTQTRYYFGDDDSSLKDNAWYISNRDEIMKIGKSYSWFARPVGQKKPNAWGLYDMHGNVWEWCADWYAGSYSSASSKDPSGPKTGYARVLRGGGWFYYKAMNV